VQASGLLIKKYRRDAMHRILAIILIKMQLTLTRYWFEFDYSESDWANRLGCGVTAYNYDDAIHLLNKHMFKGEPFPTIKKVIENINVSSLDANHILINISKPPNLRGIWFPSLWI